MKSRLLYAGLVLLIILLLMVIGYLGSILFAFEPWRAPGMRATVPADPDAPREAVADMLIETGDVPPDGVPYELDAETVARAPAITTGVIPSVCLHYGPEIASRERHDGPITHRAIVAANGVIFHLNLADAAPGGH